MSRKLERSMSSDALIVDFPMFPRKHNLDSRAVTFNPVADVFVVPNDPKKAYSQNDIDTFKQERLITVRLLRRKLASTPVEEIGDRYLYHCIGLDRVLCRNVMVAVAAARQNHVDSVLKEQRVQVRRGADNPERLALVSKLSSRGARLWAHKAALGHLSLRLGE